MAAKLAVVQHCALVRKTDYHACLVLGGIDAPAKATIMRQLVILNCASVEELRREMRKGQLLIVPK